MSKLICPKCKKESGFVKNRTCKSRWECPDCKVCCVFEKEEKPKKSKKQTEQLSLF